MNAKDKLRLLEELEQLDKTAGRIISFIDREGNGQYECQADVQNLLPKKADRQTIETILNRYGMSAILVNVRRNNH